MGGNFGSKLQSTLDDIMYSWNGNEKVNREKGQSISSTFTWRHLGGQSVLEPLEKIILSRSGNEFFSYANISCSLGISIALYRNIVLQLCRVPVRTRTAGLTVNGSIRCVGRKNVWFTDALHVFHIIKGNKSKKITGELTEPTQMRCDKRQ